MDPRVPGEGASRLFVSGEASVGPDRPVAGHRSNQPADSIEEVPRARVGVDVGGTFTDVVLYDPQRGVSRTKIPTALDKAGDVILEALDRLEASPQSLGLFVHATTLITNVLIERRGAKVGLLTTRGFGDLLDIGLSYRPHASDLQWEKEPALIPAPLRREITERISADGEVIVPLDADQVRQEARYLAAQGAEAIAVVFLHSYANPDHELAARRVIIEELPEVHLSLSSEIDPQIREYERTTTTVLNAYAAPAIADYVGKLDREVATPPDATFYMHSGGGVVPPGRVISRPIELVSSGPAAGVLAAAFIGRHLGIPDLITFDTGGTSADVCLIENGRAQEREATEVSWGVPLRTRCIDVTSVGAGGGSIAWIDSGGTLRVGPRSAGGNPGPVCYGLGGEQPTVTDANLILGLLDPAQFLGGRMRLDPGAAKTSVGGIAAQLDLSLDEAANGIRRIATANMAQAVHQITVQKGIDPRGFTLVAFGGAGGQHAVEVAAEMEIDRVLFPPLPSTFSAFGLLSANLRATEQTAFLRRLDDEMPGAKEVFQDLTDQAMESVGLSAGAANGIGHERHLQLRYLGQTHELTMPLPVGGWAAVPAAFEEAHERLFGTHLGDPIEVVALGVTVDRILAPIDLPTPSAGSGSPELGEQRVTTSSSPFKTYSRPAMAPGFVVAGPCLLYEEDSTIVLPDGWAGKVGQFGELLVINGRSATDAMG